jgi:hypothetical protein
MAHPQNTLLEMVKGGESVLPSVLLLVLIGCGGSRGLEQIKWGRAKSQIILTDIRPLNNRTKQFKQLLHILYANPIKRQYVVIGSL